MTVSAGTYDSLCIGSRLSNKTKSPITLSKCAETLHSLVVSSAPGSYGRLTFFSRRRYCDFLFCSRAIVLLVHIFFALRTNESRCLRLTGINSLLARFPAFKLLRRHRRCSGSLSFHVTHNGSGRVQRRVLIMTLSPESHSARAVRFRFVFCFRRSLERRVVVAEELARACCCCFCSRREHSSARFPRRSKLLPAITRIT